MTSFKSVLILLLLGASLCIHTPKPQTSNSKPQPQTSNSMMKQALTKMFGSTKMMAEKPWDMKSESNQHKLNKYVEKQFGMAKFTEQPKKLAQALHILDWLKELLSSSAKKDQGTEPSDQVMSKPDAEKTTTEDKPFKGQRRRGSHMSRVAQTQDFSKIVEMLMELAGLDEYDVEELMWDLMSAEDDLEDMGHFESDEDKVEDAGEDFLEKKEREVEHKVDHEFGREERAARSNIEREVKHEENHVRERLGDERTKLENEVKHEENKATRAEPPLGELVTEQKPRDLDMPTSIRPNNTNQRRRGTHMNRLAESQMVKNVVTKTKTALKGQRRRGTHMSRLGEKQTEKSPKKPAAGKPKSHTKKSDFAQKRASRTIGKGVAQKKSSGKNSHTSKADKAAKTEKDHDKSAADTDKATEATDKAKELTDKAKAATDKAKALTHKAKADSSKKVFAETPKKNQGGHPQKPKAPKEKSGAQAPKSKKQNKNPTKSEITHMISKAFQ